MAFPLILKHVNDMVTVSEQAIKDAVRFCLHQFKIVAEPSGVLGLAALLQDVVRPVGKTAVVISGSNVDDSVLAELLVSS